MPLIGSVQLGNGIELKTRLSTLPLHVRLSVTLWYGDTTHKVVHESLCVARILAPQSMNPVVYVNDTLLTTLSHPETLNVSMTMPSSVIICATTNSAAVVAASRYGRFEVASYSWLASLVGMLVVNYRFRK